MRPEREKAFDYGKLFTLSGRFGILSFHYPFTILFTILSPICNTIATFFKYLCSGKKSYCFL